MGSNGEGRYQQYKAVDCYAAGEQAPRLRVVIEREGEKYGAPADRIHDRKESTHHQENALSDLKHSLALRGKHG